MAYFPNGSAGMCFDEQCNKCKYGDGPCPIAFVQMEYNYNAVGNTIASAILDHLVWDNGDCAMYKAFEHDLAKDMSQGEMF